MRTVAAFLATVLIAVPAAWRVLDADIQRDGPATKPKVQTIEIDGAKITVELDRGLLMAGDKLVARLVATSETPRTIALDVRAMEDMGYGGERIPNPPRQVGRRKLNIQAIPGGKITDVAFTLGSRGKKGSARWFDIEVARLGTKRDDDRFTSEDAEDGLPSTARVGAATWSGNSFAMTIEPPAVIPDDQNFTVAVRVTNTTKQPIQWLEVEIGGSELAYGGLEGHLYLNDREDSHFTTSKTVSENSDEPLAPGETRVYHFDVLPQPTALDGVPEYTLTAHAFSSTGGALDVITLKAAHVDPPAVVAAPASTAPSSVATAP